MDQTLENFIKALRGADVPVSIGEAIDAFNTVDVVGLTDRQVLKNSLGSVLAKTVEHRRTFDDCFDLFFARDLPSDGQDNSDDSESTDPADAGGDLIGMVMGGDGAGIAAAMESAANQVGASNIQVFTQRGIYARRILDEMGLRTLERRIAAQRRQGTADAEAEADALEQARTALLGEARAFVERQYQIYGVPASDRLRDEMLAEARLSGLETRDLARMHRIVRRMAKRLAAKHSRRRRSAKRGQLDIRKMLRANVAYDGVPFETIWKQRRVDRPRVVAICDVSRSVAAVARFLLLFLYSLHEVIPEIRAFAFSDRLVEVSDTLEAEEIEQALVLILDRIGFRSTDYGRALADFEDGFGDWVDRRTTVVIMGDGRSNNTDPRTDLMRQLHDRAKRVVWLNPEPKTVWGGGDSEMLRYLPHCHLATECNTVKHLERVVDDLLRIYSTA
ncbi:MAG: VWA domain-containing protein [Minwuiales bacterium]|nr:VWA domain-containing protein [Minwuiales bacterium]